MLYMNNTAVINIKTKPEIKLAAQELADELGLTLSALINGSLRRLIQTRVVTFTPRSEENPTPYMLKALKESEEDIKAGRVISFDNPQKMFSYLDKLIKADERSAN